MWQGWLSPSVGALRETGDPWEPFQLVDPAGVLVAPVAAYLRTCRRAAGRRRRIRSYGMDLLRWFRLCWAAGLAWDQVTRAEAGEFCRWMALAGTPGAPAGAAARWQGGRWGITGCGDREAGAWPHVRGGHGGALRDRAASFLRFPPRVRVRADGEPVPAGPRPRWPGPRASQPDGAISAAPVGAVPAAGRAACPAAHPR